MPKISVLMPVYKTNPKHLKEAIASILSQTFVDFEFLILNDSPDATYLDKIVESYDDERIRYVKNDCNMGIAPSRNKLIDMARGEYLAVMDHDDISLPERFAKQAMYLDEHPDIGVISCWAKFFPKKKTYVNPEQDSDIRLALMNRCALLHPSSMIRKSVLVDNHVRYDERFTPSEDYALWCRLIPYAKFYNMPEVLFRYRSHATNTSKVQSEKMTNAAQGVRAFARMENPLLYNEFMIKATVIKRVCIFGIPLFKIVQKNNRTRGYLFGKIPLWAAKTRMKI